MFLKLFSEYKLFSTPKLLQRFRFTWQYSPEWKSTSLSWGLFRVWHISLEKERWWAGQSNKRWRWKTNLITGAISFFIPPALEISNYISVHWKHMPEALKRRTWVCRGPQPILFKWPPVLELSRYWFNVLQFSFSPLRPGFGLNLQSLHALWADPDCLFTSFCFSLNTCAINCPLFFPGLCDAQTTNVQTYISNLMYRHFVEFGLQIWHHIQSWHRICKIYSRTVHECLCDCSQMLPKCHIMLNFLPIVTTYTV